MKAAAGDESATQRRKRQKLAGGTALAVGEEVTGAVAGAAAAETVRWMSWSSQRRAFQCAAISCCISWLVAGPLLQLYAAYSR